MTTLVNLVDARRVAKAHLADRYPAAAPSMPAGCKGPACPAFALCQGRCPPAVGNG